MSVFDNSSNKNNDSDNNKFSDESSLNNYRRLFDNYINAVKTNLHKNKLSSTSAGRKILELEPEDSVGMVMMCINTPPRFPASSRAEHLCRTTIVLGLLRETLPLKIISRF